MSESGPPVSTWQNMVTMHGVTWTLFSNLRDDWDESIASSATCVRCLVSDVTKTSDQFTLDSGPGSNPQSDFCIDVVGIRWKCLMNRYTCKDVDSNLCYVNIWGIIHHLYTHGKSCMAIWMNEWMNEWMCWESNMYMSVSSLSLYSFFMAVK